MATSDNGERPGKAKRSKKRRHPKNNKPKGTTHGIQHTEGEAADRPGQFVNEQEEADAAIIIPDPWARQDWESSKAFQAFKFYRETPAADRSIKRCVTAYYELYSDEKKEDVKISSKIRLWSLWSSKNEWQYRIKAWEREQDRMLRLREMAAIRKMRKRHAELALAMQELAVQRLNELDPAEMSPTNVLEYLKTAVAMERTARGEPETISTHYNYEGGAAPATPDLGIEDYSDEELEGFAKALDLFEALSVKGGLPAGDEASLAAMMDGNRPD